MDSTAWPNPPVLRGSLPDELLTGAIFGGGGSNDAGGGPSTTVSARAAPATMPEATSTVAVPSTAAAASESGMGAYLVRFSLLLNITLSAFPTFEPALREQLALAVGLTRAEATCVSLSFLAARRGQLPPPAAGAIAVDVTISLLDAASAARAAASLTVAAIDAALASVGLPAAIITSSATVSTLSVSAASTAAFVSPGALALILVLAAVASAAATTTSA